MSFDTFFVVTMSASYLVASATMFAGTLSRRTYLDTSALLSLIV